MADNQINPVDYAIEAVSTRIAFYRQIQFALDDWLRAEPSRTADYRAAQAEIDVELIPLQAELEALDEGEVTISSPGAETIAALQAAVQRLTVRISAARAASDFMTLIADTTTEFKDATA